MPMLLYPRGERFRESQLSSAIPQGSPPSSDERQAYQFVFGQLALGRKDPDIVNLLVTKGIAIDRAQFIVQAARTQRVNFLRLRSRRRIRNGSIAILVGVALTGVTLVAAASGVTGGFYVVSFGPILFGIYYLALGISDRMKR